MRTARPWTARDSGHERDDLAGAARVQVGQGLVEEQQPGAAGQRVGDQHALLLAAGEQANAGVGERPGADRLEHLVDDRSPPAGGQDGPEPVTVDAERDKVTGAQRRIGIERELLRHVADQRVATRARSAGDQHPPELAGVIPRMTRNSVVLPAPFDPINPTNSPGSTEMTSARTSRPPRRTPRPSMERISASADDGWTVTAGRASRSRSRRARPARSRAARPASMTGSVARRRHGLIDADHRDAGGGGRRKEALGDGVGHLLVVDQCLDPVSGEQRVLGADGLRGGIGAVHDVVLEAAASGWRSRPPAAGRRRPARWSPQPCPDAGFGTPAARQPPSQRGVKPPLTGPEVGRVGGLQRRQVARREPGRRRASSSGCTRGAGWGRSRGGRAASGRRSPGARRSATRTRSWS